MREEAVHQRESEGRGCSLRGPRPWTHWPFRGAPDPVRSRRRDKGAHPAADAGSVAPASTSAQQGPRLCHADC